MSTFSSSCGWSFGFFFALLGVVIGVSLVLHLVIFFPGSYFLLDTTRCSFFGWTMKLSATFACDIFVSKNLLHNSIWTAAASQQVACLAGILSSFWWKGHGRTTLEHSSSNVSLAVNLSFLNFISTGLHRFPSMRSWMRGQTAFCIMKVNCSLSNISLRWTITPATLERLSCVCYKLLKSFTTAFCPLSSNALCSFWCIISGLSSESLAYLVVNQIGHEFQACILEVV